MCQGQRAIWGRKGYLETSAQRAAPGSPAVDTYPNTPGRAVVHGLRRATGTRATSWLCACLCGDKQWSEQRAAADRTQSHRLLLFSTCPPLQCSHEMGRTLAPCCGAGTSKTLRVAKGQVMGRDVTLKPRRAFVGKTRTLPSCVQQPPHHMGDCIPCTTGDSPCAARDGGMERPPSPGHTRQVWQLHGSSSKGKGPLPGLGTAPCPR